MTGSFAETIDWDRFWSEADEERRETAVASRHHLRGMLAEFVAEKGVPDAVADVGCGNGLVAFDVAERHPETTVVGYDAADAILTENRERARERGLRNVTFERAVLPAFDPDRTFDLVVCYATLCYVPEVEDALRALYDAVAPGGHLVLGYVNRHGAAHFRRTLESLRAEDDPDRDPDRFAERFGLVISGENVLSYDRIHDALGTWPRSFWEFTEEPDVRWAWDHVPLVWVPK
jgi:ubiquinone/menaquinone biosynthesis C-methylase UbiE